MDLSDGIHATISVWTIVNGVRINQRIDVTTKRSVSSLTTPSA
jgi:hypothetical protein